MKIKYFKIILFAVGILNVSVVLSQNFNQFNATNMSYNSAFAGSLIDGRLSIDNRTDNIYKQTVYDYNTQKNISITNFTNRYYAGYDQYLSKLKGGIGVYITGYNDFDHYNQLTRINSNDTSGGPSSYLTKSFNLNICYSRKIKLSEKLTLSPAINFNFYTNAATSKIELYNSSTNTKITNEYFNFNNQGVGIAFGLLLNTENFYVGLSTDNYLFVSKENWLEKDFLSTDIYQDTTYYFKQLNLSKIPGLNLHASYTFKFKNKDLSITPMAMLSFGREKLLPYDDIEIDSYRLQQIFISTNIKYKKIEIGCGIKASNILIGLIAYNFRNLRIAYSIASQGHNRNEILYSNYKTTHELSIRYIIKGSTDMVPEKNN